MLNNFRITDIFVSEGEIAISGSQVCVRCAYGFKDAYYSTLETKCFVLEEGGEEPGLVEGIKGMRVGGKRSIEAPVSLWWGEKLCPQGIQPNHPLTYIVELLMLK